MLIVRRLLANADEALSAEGSRIDGALERIGKAFEYFRTDRDDGEVVSASRGASEPERPVLRQLAAAIAEIDDSVSSRDSQRIRAALANAGRALDECQRMDDPFRESGVRTRLQGNQDAAALRKRPKSA
jgi:hypothetical protein